VIRLWIWMMMVTVVMIMMVVVVMVVVMIMMVVVMIMICHQTAFARTKGGAKRTIFDITAGGRYPLAFHMVMVAFLRQSYFFLKTQHG
jgi:hypothetical protein